MASLMRVVVVAVVVAGTACSKPSTQADGALAAAPGQAQVPRVDVPTGPPSLAGTWNVLVKQGAYDGCGIKQQDSAAQWLVSQDGERLTLRISAADGTDQRLSAVIDAQRVILLSDDSVQLAKSDPNERTFFGDRGGRSAQATWLLKAGDGSLSGVRSLVVDLGEGSHPRKCLVEQTVGAKRQ